jgi:hypothetical protein
MINFMNPERIDDVFCKVLTPNDDSGRHGVLIPVFAYRIFPEFNNFEPTSSINYEEPIVTHWSESVGWTTKNSKWKHYHRYPERRMTSLSPELLNNKIENSLLIVGKYKDAFEYECILIAPDNPSYYSIAELFHINLHQEKITGLSAISPFHELISPKTTILDELVAKVTEISKRGFIPSIGIGDRGIGLTFENLLDIQPNSDKEPDYKGIEIKCSSSLKAKHKRTVQTGKQTLFAQIPEWGFAKDRKGLVEKYGYLDEERDRKALYITIKVVPNNRGWSLEVVESEGLVYVCLNEERILHYNMSNLKHQLESKHKESIFVTAHKQTLTSGSEEYHYDSLVHAKDVLFPEFISLIKENLIGLDFAIHLKDGKARDHGFLWRLDNKKHLFRLFKYVAEIF